METREKKVTPNMDLAKFKDFVKTPLFGLIAYGVVAIALILISHFALQIPVVAVCVIVVLEAFMAACLSRIPLWIHGLVIIANVIIGIMASKVVFMVLMVLIYIFCVALLYIWNKHE